MDALPALCRAGECGDPEREAGGGYGVVKCAGAVVSADAAGEGACIGACGCADCAAEADLSVSLCDEGRAEAGAGRGFARDAAVRRCARNSTPEPGGGRRG